VTRAAVFYALALGFLPGSLALDVAALALGSWWARR